MLRAVETHPDRIGEPLALTVNYAAPIADGDLTLRAPRTNRTNRHWIVELSQDGAVKTTATAIFAIRRDSWADTESDPPSAPPPEQLPAVDPGLVRWTALYDMRYVEGAMPGKGGDPSPSSTSTLWVRDGAGRPVDYPALAAVCDILYPRVFLRRGGFIPSETISLTTYSTSMGLNSTPSRATSCWPPLTPTGFRAVISTRARRCGPGRAGCWRPPIRSSTSRAAGFTLRQ